MVGVFFVVFDVLLVEVFLFGVLLVEVFLVGVLRVEVVNLTDDCLLEFCLNSPGRLKKRFSSV